METWYLLYGGISEDGRGPGTYIGRTTNKAKAQKHDAVCRKDPYSTGKVVIVTDTTHTTATPWTDWSTIP